MSRNAAPPVPAVDLAWLFDVTESRQPLSETSPIWARESLVHEGPPIRHPERHPYCEINILLSGSGPFLADKEQCRRTPGSLALLGPGVPHWGRIEKYPLHSIMVYFLPSLLIEMGPASGARILRRFTAKQSLADRLVRPPRKMFQHLAAVFREILSEFEGERFGREIRMRTLLMEMLVSLLRWEQRQGRRLALDELEADWRPILRTLQFLREHYAEPIYAREVARAAGVSESRLKALFHQAVGLSWVKFLQGYRIHRAAARLHESGHNVTEAALAVGFESLSHFNATFRSFMGASPKDYARIVASRTTWPRPRTSRVH